MADPRRGSEPPVDAEAPLDDETLRALEERLERATRAAERLLASATLGDRVPPAGWRRDDDADGGASGRWVDAEDAERLFVALAGVLDRVPSELQQRLVAALRELLLAVRALIDWCLERAERRRAAPTEVQDIPIL